MRQVLLDSEEPTVVVAHSYGGIVTAEAAADAGSVRHLVLVSSYLPDPGYITEDIGERARWGGEFTVTSSTGDGTRVPSRCSPRRTGPA